MESGSTRHGRLLDAKLKEEAEALERSGKEPHVEEERDKHDAPGHRVAGSGTSTHDRPDRDRGDEGGAGHPRPRKNE